MKNRELKIGILRYLYKVYEQNPHDYATREMLKYNLSIDDRTLDENVIKLYNDDKVDIMEKTGLRFFSAQITQRGIAILKKSSDKK
ncbi:MAG: hypothetical protein ACLQG5_04440 [Methanobacterium sp.]|jgi:hypothetical protein